MQPISEVIKIEDPNTFQRLIYTSNIISQIKNSDPIKFLTIRPNSFNVSDSDTYQECDCSSLISCLKTTLNTEIYDRIINSSSNSDSTEIPLDQSKIVVCGGRGVGSQEKFQLVYELADSITETTGIKANVGGTRVAVDSGYISYDKQIGQSGASLNADIYIGIGVSGAIQHLAGISDCKTIIAINKDKAHPIFSVSDYGMIGDLHEIVPELIKSLKK